eukprot:snap_masked-scaffold815_size93432-processed-gene-0.11 protein:Tk07749 transcript:snap_masked-scaffold815_size93432-processed-gene-0.11-mRNA-1 annotation:"glucuronokinase 1-like"
MICVLQLAGHQPQLDSNIKGDVSGKYAHLEGVPKALLPGVGGKKILDCWWELIKNRQLFSEVFMVCNADKIKHFERWATASDFPVGNIVNDGTTSRDSRLGAVADLQLALKVKKIRDQPILVIAGDILFQDQKFDLTQVTNFHANKSDGDLAIYYELHDHETIDTRGMVEVCPFTNRILKFLEKPDEHETTSRNASVPFYCFRASTLAKIDEYLSLFPDVENRSFGNLLSWLVNAKEHLIYGMKLPTGFQLIGQTTLADYESWIQYFTEQNKEDARSRRIAKRAYARIGLMGNPSDGFFGKTISLSIKNFWAEVTICESSKLVLIPHPLCDPTEFGSLADLHGISTKEGYLGGLRLLQATCKKFYHYCSTRGIALAKRNFSLKYDTNIPRQVGLAGSSAIVTATLKCLMEFFHITNKDIPKEIQPQFILEVEVAELCINAGLQDRVIQASLPGVLDIISRHIYEGLVYMDFSADLMLSKGFGVYERLEVATLPQLFICYSSNGSDSGKIHSDVRKRFDRGDEEVQKAMKTFANLTLHAKSAILEQDWERLSALMQDNFALRKSIYGEACVGEENLKMIDIGSKFGAACKFPGSGGAIVGLLLDPSQLDLLKSAFEEEGFVFVKVIPNL